jgi:RNA polymerase sigma-70 factor (ECF subfamily)
MPARSDDARQVLLVLRAQAGDRCALEELLTRVQSRLYAFLLRMLGDRHDAEEVLQEVLLLICRKLAWLESAALFNAWSYRIAAREAFRRRRLRGRAATELASLASCASAATREPSALEVDERPAVEKNLGALSSNTRAVVILHYFEGLSLSATADVLGIPEGTAKSRLAHALTALRRAMPSR